MGYVAIKGAPAVCLQRPLSREPGSPGGAFDSGIHIGRNLDESNCWFQDRKQHATSCCGEWQQLASAYELAELLAESEGGAENTSVKSFLLRKEIL